MGSTLAIGIDFNLVVPDETSHIYCKSTIGKRKKKDKEGAKGRVKGKERGERG